MKKLSTILFVILFVALLLASAYGGYRFALRNAPKSHADTIKVVQYHIDTIIVSEPKYITKYIRDSIYIPISDTIKIKDTTYITLPREVKVYQDSTYLAKVSGYQPALDYIEVYQKTKTITNTIFVDSRKRWGLGVQVGYGVSRDGLSPYVGVGLSYNIINF